MPAHLLLVLPFAALAALGDTSRIAWTRDYVKAQAEARERRQPLLFQFRGENCGLTSVPGQTDEKGRPAHDTQLSPCDLMQADVWESPAVVEAAERFQAVLADGGDRTLQTRYQVVRHPTLLVADPWGTEVFRMTGYVPREQVSRALQAVPSDFAALEKWSLTLRENSQDFAALFEAARFYEGTGLRQVSERLYEAALSSPSARSDLDRRRKATVARGVNLMRMEKFEEAARLFAKELEAAPTGPESDALLYGLMTAELQAGRHKEAETAYGELQKRFAGSAYTARAKQVLESSAKK